MAERMLEHYEHSDRLRKYEFAGAAHVDVSSAGGEGSLSEGLQAALSSALEVADRQALVRAERENTNCFRSSYRVLALSPSTEGSALLSVAGTYCFPYRASDSGV